jgi:hypothetical protein
MGFLRAWPAWVSRAWVSRAWVSRAWVSRAWVSRAWVSRSWTAWARTAGAWTARACIVPACVTAMAALPAGGAVAQDQPPDYETPLYTTQPRAALDPNYGLPSFGMPGAELPQQRTMGTPEKPDPTKTDQADTSGAAGGAGTAGGAASGTTDFFAGSTEIALPQPRTSPSQTSPSAQPDSDTPLYTTSQGSTTGDAPSATGETPLYDDGSTTSDQTSVGGQR